MTEVAYTTETINASYFGYPNVDAQVTLSSFLGYTQYHTINIPDLGILETRVYKEHELKIRHIMNYRQHTVEVIYE